MPILNHTTPVKRCTKCGNEYPATLEHFGPDKRGKSGLLARCRACQSEYDRQRRLENIEARREYDREYRAEHRDERAERHRNYYAANREAFKAQARQYHTEHRDQQLERRRRWAAANPDYARRQYAKDPVTGRLRAHARRARKLANGGTYTVEDLAAIRAAQTDKKGRLICWKCGEPIVNETPELDHWIPLKRAGQNSPGNLHYMHAHCNRTKQAKHPFDLGRLL